MIKILIANDCLTGGGVENVLENFVRYLSQHKYQVHLMIPNCKKEEVSSLFGENIVLFPGMRELKKERRLSFAWFVDRGLFVVQRLIFRMRFLLCKFDVVIALKEGPTMKEISKLYAKKKYAWVHVDYNYLYWTKCFFKSSNDEVNCMKKFDEVVCVSHAAKNSVIETIGDPGNLCVKYNPIDYQRILKYSNLSHEVNQVKDGFLFVTVGRLSQQKNYHLIIEACAKLEKKYQFTLWIIGDGPLKAELEEIIKQKNLKNVQLLGMKKNPYPYIKMADAYVSSAKWESYGLAIQEALILGKPVIAVKCPAIEETLDSKFGLLVENNVDELYTAMEKMMIDSSLCKSLVRNISELYMKDRLFDERMNEICSLWENA